VTRAIPASAPLFRIRAIEFQARMPETGAERGIPNPTRREST
jgi:hypothetical protein